MKSTIFCKGIMIYNKKKLNKYKKINKKFKINQIIISSK